MRRTRVAPVRVEERRRQLPQPRLHLRHLGRQVPGEVVVLRWIRLDLQSLSQTNRRTDGGERVLVSCVEEAAGGIVGHAAAEPRRRPGVAVGPAQSLTRQQATSQTSRCSEESRWVAHGSGSSRWMLRHHVTPLFDAFCRNDRSQWIMVVRKTQECSRESRGPATSRSRTSPRQR